MNIPRIPNLGGVIKVGKTFFSANKPEILYGGSIVSTLAAVVLSARGGYKSGQQVVYAEHPYLDDLDARYQKLEFSEKAAMTWKNYVPAAAATVGALGSTTGLHLAHIKEKKAIATALVAAVEEGKDEIEKLRDFEDKAIELAEEAGADGIEIENSDGIVEELYLVRDARTGRDIWSNKNRIEDAVNEVNNILVESDCDLNTFYNYAGFADIPDGLMYGWSGSLIGITWEPKSKDDGRPVMEFTFRPQPTKGFDSRK